MSDTELPQHHDSDDDWHRLPAYRDTVGSVDIYGAVLDYGVRSPDEFRAWLQERRNN